MKTGKLTGKTTSTVPPTKDMKPKTPRKNGPLSTIDTNIQSFIDTEDKNYKAYRSSDAVSITRITSPIRESHLRTPRNPPGRAPQIPSRTPSPDTLFDRFSGGLDYGWERGAGFSGSAGTREKNSDKAKRKSLLLSENFGVDLSDVPVFVVKASEGK